MSERVCVIGAGSSADGTFSESGLGAADVPEEASGTWRLDRDSIVLSDVGRAEPGLAEGPVGGRPRPDHAHPLAQTLLAPRWISSA
ncbi:MAG TPA: hypothetical protein VFY37_09190, partial [Solirubrobacterales bacterium]|nr:hypothetical protein [Solirubrobacterales bacterium]